MAASYTTKRRRILAEVKVHKESIDREVASFQEKSLCSETTSENNSLPLVNLIAEEGDFQEVAHFYDAVLPIADDQTSENGSADNDVERFYDSQENVLDMEDHQEDREPVQGAALVPRRSDQRQRQDPAQGRVSAHHQRDAQAQRRRVLR